MTASAPSTVHHEESSHPRGAVAALCFGGLIAALTQTLVIPIQSELPRLLGSSPANTAWIVTITLLAGAVTMPVAGRVADLIGKRRVLLVCVGILVVGSVVCALSSSLAPLFGSFTQSAFAQNVGLVAVTGVKSRYVVASAGAILIALGLLPVMGRIIAAVPPSVLGGAGVVLFGTVAASGIRTLSKVDYTNNMNLIIVATSLGFGMIPIAAPQFYEHFPAWFATIFHSGISSAAVMAIAMNLLFNHFRVGNSDQQSVFVAGMERTLRYQDIACLHEGDYFLDGKLYDSTGKPVPIVAHEH